MGLFGLIFFFVMLVLVGVGIAVGLVACLITAVLVGVGMLSSSVVIGLLARRASAGVRAFLLQLLLLLGVPSGIVCALCSLNGKKQKQYREESGKLGCGERRRQVPQFLRSGEGGSRILSETVRPGTP